MSENEYTGGKVNYYEVFVENPTREGREPYVAECNDVIEALKMTFAEGEALKALWRKAAARILSAKRGYTDGLYDSEKVSFYGGRLVVIEKSERQKSKDSADALAMNNLRSSLGVGAFSPDKRHPMTPNVIEFGREAYPAVQVGVDVSFEGEGRIDPIVRNGNGAEHYGINMTSQRCNDCGAMPGGACGYGTAENCRQLANGCADQ